MNSKYLYEYINHLEVLLAVAHHEYYSLDALERSIAYSQYFQSIEKDLIRGAPIIEEEKLLKEIFPELLHLNIEEIPIYNECLWVAEAYLRIQGVTRLTLEAIFLYLPIEEIYELFPLYHEMDFSQIIKLFQSKYSKQTTFSLLLKKYNYSLNEISKLTNIPYNTLFALKKRHRDIKKADVKTVVSLANILNVRVETIAELEI